TALARVAAHRRERGSLLLRLLFGGLRLGRSRLLCCLLGRLRLGLGGLRRFGGRLAGGRLLRGWFGRLRGRALRKGPVPVFPEGRRRAGPHDWSTHCLLP